MCVYIKKGIQAFILGKDGDFGSDHIQSTTQFRSHKQKN